MNEDHLDELGEQPLLDFMKVVRNLYNGKVLEVHNEAKQKPLTVEETKLGLTAAIAFLHSRGKQILEATSPSSHHFLC